MAKPTPHRSGGRSTDELRAVQFKQNIAEAAQGSVLICMGNTEVICTASIEASVPRWMRAQSVAGGWITAEYSMLPGSTSPRSRRESSAGRVGGRTMEIQRLIGRSLRAVVDLEALGARTIWLDCDVLRADGGTRTASITGAYVALRMAVNSLLKSGVLESDPVGVEVAAISVGIVDGEALLDLCYEEDVGAEVDMNVVMTGTGRYIEIQGTAEGAPFSKATLRKLERLAEKGILDLVELQRQVLLTP